METKDIIKSCIHGDQAAFGILVDRYTDYAFSVAFRIINNEEDAKDIVLESFVSAWKNMGRFNPDRNFSNWLYRIIVNKCYDTLRKSSRVSMIYPDEDQWNTLDLASESNPESELSNKESGLIIRMLTGRLSPKQKIVFILSELEGLPHEDIQV